MIEIIPGASGRQVIVRHSEDAGWTLEWRDTDELIQDRIYSTLELVQCLASTMSREDCDEADEYRAKLMRAEDSPRGAELPQVPFSPPGGPVIQITTAMLMPGSAPRIAEDQDDSIEITANHAGDAVRAPKP